MIRLLVFKAGAHQVLTLAGLGDNFGELVDGVSADHKINQRNIEF